MEDDSGLVHHPEGKDDPGGQEKREEEHLPALCLGRLHAVQVSMRGLGPPRKERKAPGAGLRS